MGWLLGAKNKSGGGSWGNYESKPPGYDMPSNAPAPTAALAQAQSIPLATDGLSDPSVPASVPKWNLILPQNPVAALGTGVEQQLDFNIQCQDIGKIQNVLVNFNYSTAVGKTPVIVPTPYFVTRVDFFAPDGSTLETLYNDMLFTETCSLLSDQAVNTVSGLYNFGVNLSTTGTAAAGTTGAGLNPTTTSSVAVTGSTPTSGATVVFADATTASQTYSHWLSLNSSFLVACQPYLRGCGSGYFKVRLYLAPNLASDGSAVTQGALVANYVNLWVQEAVLSDSAERALKMAHRSGIQYSSVVRNQYSLTMVAITANNISTLQLQGFFAESAGLYLMFKPSNSNSDCITRTPVASMYLQDSQGRQLTQNLEVGLIESIISPAVVAVSSYFVNSYNQTTYIFPFSTNIQRVIEGKMLGSYQLTGNERLVVTASPSGIAAGSIFNAISWDYAKLVVVNNQARQYVLGSNNNS
jgi:hypothetical protein